jgi:hypothetical protein
MNLDFPRAAWHDRISAVPPKIHQITIVMVIPKMLSGRRVSASGVTRILALGMLGLFSILFCSQAEAAPSVTLAWNPSPSPGIMGYRLHYGVSSGSYSVIIDVGNTTTATVQNLTVGQPITLW